MNEPDQILDDYKGPREPRITLYDIFVLSSTLFVTLIGFIVVVRSLIPDKLIVGLSFVGLVIFVFILFLYKARWRYSRKMGYKLSFLYFVLVMVLSLSIMVFEELYTKGSLNTTRVSSFLDAIPYMAIVLVIPCLVISRIILGREPKTNKEETQA